MVTIETRKDGKITLRNGDGIRIATWKPDIAKFVAKAILAELKG